jgi:pilus assembly protein CpaF
MTPETDITTVTERLSALLADDGISEIMIDGPDRIYVEREGRLEDIDIRFADGGQIVEWANGLLTDNGWDPIDRDKPWVERRLRDGTYLLIVVEPVAANGPSIVIKRPWRDLITLDQLLQWGCVSPAIVDFLRVAIRARRNVLVAGGTNSGKTTLGRIVAEMIPAEERLLIISEPGSFLILQIQHERVVYLEAQPGGGGSGEADLGSLLRLARRMRADRIFMSEFEGAEVLEALSLMNHGHQGMLSTIHAESPRDALSRLETLATVAEPSLPLPAIRAQIAAAFNLVVYQAYLEDGSRRVTSVAEVQGLKGNSIVIQELFAWEKTGVGPDGRFTGVHRATGAVPSFAPELAARGLAFPDGMFET